MVLADWTLIDYQVDLSSGKLSSNSSTSALPPELYHLTSTLLICLHSITFYPSLHALVQ